LKNTKYLYKRNNIYYFSKKINKKAFKISLKSSNLDYCIMLRDKIIKELKLNEKKEIIDKILNKETITKQESKIVYSQSEIEEMDQQHNAMYKDFSNQEIKEIKDNLENIEQEKENQKIKKIEEKIKDNRQLEIIKRLDNLEQNNTQIEQEKNDIFNNLDN